MSTGHCIFAQEPYARALPYTLSLLYRFSLQRI